MCLGGTTAPNDAAGYIDLGALATQAEHLKAVCTSFGDCSVVIFLRKAHKMNSPAYAVAAVQAKEDADKALQSARTQHEIDKAEKQQLESVLSPTKPVNAHTAADAMDYLDYLLRSCYRRKLICS